MTHCFQIERNFLLLVGLPCVCLSLALIPHTRASEGIEDTLKLTPQYKALPIWEKPNRRARQSLGGLIRRMQKGILMVGDPEKGHGTAWVLSREHRLLVTNAHVADLMYPHGTMQAIVNGTAEVHEVESVWYHPGVRRRSRRSRSTSIRSTNPAHGRVDPRSPDVAVLQLSAKGPPLTTELKMATERELKTLFAQTVGMLGFPGHDTKDWPDRGEHVRATYHDGVVSRLTDFHFNPNVAFEELQFVQTTLGSWQGFSGAPVYLSNGHVVATNNMVRVETHHDATAMIPHGVRVDCVWELLAHHGLDHMVPVQVDESRIARWLMPDERDGKLRRAIQLVEEAEQLVEDGQQYLKGRDKCSDAIRIAPEYPASYKIRGMALNNHWTRSYRKLPRKESIRLLRDALSDFEKHASLMGSSDPSALASYCMVLTNVGAYTKHAPHSNKALTILDKLLTSENLRTSLRAYVCSIQGCAYNNLGKTDRAKDMHDRAVEIDPSLDVVWDNRAFFRRSRGQRELAAADRDKAVEIRQQRLLQVKQ